MVSFDVPLRPARRSISSAGHWTRLPSDLTALFDHRTPLFDDRTALFVIEPRCSMIEPRCSSLRQRRSASELWCRGIERRLFNEQTARFQHRSSRARGGERADGDPAR
jgi:hypothetical protein